MRLIFYWCAFYVDGPFWLGPQEVAPIISAEAWNKVALCRWQMDAITCQRKGGCEREKKKKKRQDGTRRGEECAEAAQDNRMRPSLVGAPVEMTCEVRRGGTEMCSLVRLVTSCWVSPPSASRSLQTPLPLGAIAG